MHLKYKVEILPLTFNIETSLKEDVEVCDRNLNPYNETSVPHPHQVHNRHTMLHLIHKIATDY